MKKAILLSISFFLVSPITSQGLASFFLNENAVIPEREKLTLLVEYQPIQRYLPSMEEYTITKVSIKSTYSPNNNVEVGFEIPYLKMNGVNDSGTLGDIKLSSKFSIIKEVFSLVDIFLLQTTLNLNINLATGIKKEDSYRNIGLQKALYYPLSAGYPDLEIGFSSSLVGTIFALSSCISLISVSSKIEPPLAFNTENDNILLGITLEIFLHYSKKLTIKIFSESTYFIPLSEKSKYQDLFLLGTGIWSKSFESLIIKLGYYKNLSQTIYIENTFNSTFILGIGIRI